MDDYDEQAAWSCFTQTGRVQDYLIYTQCKQQNAAADNVLERRVKVHQAHAVVERRQAGGFPCRSRQTAW